MTDPESIILLTSGYDARTLDADKRRGGELHDRRRRRHADRAAGVAAAWSQGVHASAPDLDGSRQRDVLQRPALAAREDLEHVAEAHVAAASPHVQV